MRAAHVVFRTLLCSVLVTLVACVGRENVRSGYLGTASMNSDQVTQLLVQNGYEDITNLHKNGQDWVGSARKDGTPVNFDIGKDGTIRTR